MTQEVNVLAPITDAAVPVDWSAAEDKNLRRRISSATPRNARSSRRCRRRRSNPRATRRGRKDSARGFAARASSRCCGRRTSASFRSRARARASSASACSRPPASAATGGGALRQNTPRLAQLQNQLQRAQAARERESSQATAQKLQTAISFGATLLGAFMGRKAVSATTLGRATTAARGVGRTMKEAEDVKRADLSVEGVQQQIDAIEAELRDETRARHQAGVRPVRSAHCRAEEDRHHGAARGARLDAHVGDRLSRSATRSECHSVRASTESVLRLSQCPD